MPSVPAIVKGDLGTVLRLPPSAFIKRQDWTQKKSDIVAHFIQVSGQISRSTWAKSPCTFTVQGGKVLKSEFASTEAFVYAAVYFRQLYAEDKLMSQACDIYANHAGDTQKVVWIRNELTTFNSTLAGGCIFYRDLPLRDLMDAFLYGALIMHGPNKASRKHRQRFQSIITNSPREEVLFELYNGLKSLSACASKVASVLYRDIAHWQQNEWIPAPEVWWHYELFGTAIPESTGST